MPCIFLAIKPHLKNRHMFFSKQKKSTLRQPVKTQQLETRTFVSIHDLHNGQGTQKEKHHLDLFFRVANGTRLERLVS